MVATDVSSPILDGKAHFYLRRLHSLTGLMFGGYLIVHLLVNATLVQTSVHEGKSVFQLQVDKIHSLPFLEVIEYAMIFLPLTFHTLYGIYITLYCRPNTGHYGYGKNWAYLLQRASALIIFAFAFFHVLGMKGAFAWTGEFGRRLVFVPTDATLSTVGHMHAAWWVGWVIYPIGILASTFHLSNGFWTGAITWGLTISRQSQQRWGYLCAGIFVLTTACGFAALTATLTRDAKSTPDGAVPAMVKSEAK
jgi:succinate dehydrogenase / fumarate reductase cytochrome b subunit